MATREEANREEKDDQWMIRPGNEDKTKGWPVKSRRWAAERQIPEKAKRAEKGDGLN